MNTVPESLRATPRERVVDLDVRDQLRAGEEPFRRIMAAVGALPQGAVLRIRATFEPEPLYRVLGKRGFAHATEELGPEDWRVWFYRDEATRLDTASPPPTPDETGRDDLIVLDVRDLDPPEPMVRTLAALKTMPPAKTLLQINSRVPQLLLPKLHQRGFVYEIHEQPEVVRVFIRHAQQENP